MVEKGLKGNALDLPSGVVIGLAATAPAYSLAATLGSIVDSVGVQGPAVILLGFIPSLFVAIAGQQLNRAKPDCGTTFFWANEAFGPRLGWLGGWCVIVTAIIAMAGIAEIAGRYALLLCGADGLSKQRWWTTAVGIGWICVMSYLCHRGIELSVRAQGLLLVTELTVLGVFSIAALAQVYSGHGLPQSTRPPLSWFDPFAIGSVSALAKGVLLAVFIYWGWDAALALNEEMAGKRRTPGLAAIISTLLLLCIYLLVSVSAQAYAGAGTQDLGLANRANSGDVLMALGDSVLGPWRGLLVLAILTSAIAAIQATILPTARAALSMATRKALPKLLACIDERHLVPAVSTFTVSGLAVLYYLALAMLSADPLGASIESIGLAIAFYYALTAFACVWYFRRRLLKGGVDLLIKGLLPLLGGLILLGAFIARASHMFSSSLDDSLPALLGVGFLLLGWLLMTAYSLFAPEYFRDETPRPSNRSPFTSGESP